VALLVISTGSLPGTMEEFGVALRRARLLALRD